MNLNSQIDWNDTDRIVSNDVRHVLLDGDWWRETSAWEARADGSSALSRVSATRTRLTGLGAADESGGVLVAETQALDARGHATVVRTRLDRAAHAVTRTTDVPGSSLAAVTVSRAGLVVSARSETGVTATYEYDALGRQVAQVDGRGGRTETVYDAQGRVTRTVDALGAATAYGHDALGRRTSVTDPLTNAVMTAYDAEGRVVSVRGAAYPVDYAYDAYGSRVSMTTYRDEALANGDTTRWLLDSPSGLVTNKVYADGRGPSYAYTPDGRLARRTWARGIVTDYTYDNAGNLTRTEYDDNGVTPTISMTYDRVGNLTAATTAGVVTNLYAYDIVGHCTNEWQNDFNLTRYYDTLGRSTGYAINGTRQTTIAYDTYGRIATMCMAEGRSGVLTASNENEFVWSYLPNSDLKASLQYPNGLTASWTYDANNQLLQVRNATPTNVISQFDYTYDAVGRRTAITKSGSAFGDLSGSIDSYTYNARSELTSARRTKNGQPIPGFSEDFDYDPIGNRRSSSTYNEKGESQTSTYEANDLNQYTRRTTPGYAAVRGEADPNATVTVNENPTFRLGSYYFGSDLFDNTAVGGLANLEICATLGQTAANGEETEDLVSAETNQIYIAQSPETFAYDDDGNQTLITTKTGLWRVTYNGENRPIRWESLAAESDNQTISNQTILTMTYDHMGRRREKNNQRFFYDGCLQIAEFTAVIPYSSFLLRNSYAWDSTEPVATRPLAWFCGDSVMCYTHDGNKNVSDAIDFDGTLSVHYEYAPFGAIIIQRGTSAALNSWRFSSEYAEDDTATVYYNYRHYEPVTGRWLCRDPYKEEEDTFFVNNDSIGLLDWLGLDWERSSCVSISHSKNFDFRNKPLGRLGPVQFNGTIASGYSLKGEACLKCCENGRNEGENRWAGSGEVKLSGEGAVTATLGVDFKTDLFWNFYKLYLFGGIQLSATLSGSGTGLFEFDGCEKTGTLSASISDSLELAIRGGVEGYLKRRGGRRNGNWHYNNIARVAALAKGAVSTSLESKLICNTEKCVLTSSYGGVEANIGLEFNFGRKQLTFDLWRFKREGHVIAEMEFESPLKGWVE